MMRQITQLHQAGIPIKQACAALDIARSSFYAWQTPARLTQTNTQRSQPARALSEQERTAVHDVLNSDRFADQAPRQVYATLLDEGAYHCSVSTMYRIMRAYGEVQERRNQRQHPQRPKPQLSAAAPNQLWSWDITKLHSPYKFVYYFLYVILDVYSRYVVGWMIAEQESSALAQQLIRQSCQRHNVQPNQLTLHSDRGAPMVALTTAQLLEKLGVQKTHSRPYTPNDNAYSEAQFKTLKYRPDFPQQFVSVQTARQWARPFFRWYNDDHHHSALTLLTPADVHFGRVATVISARNIVLQNAYQQHPERFVHGIPQHPTLPAKVWINAPEDNAGETGLLQ